MLEFFLTIVAARVRRGDLMLSTNVDERAGYRALTDDDISLTIWKMLANHRLSELFRSDDERILDTDLLIRNSFR
jgi:hypothetical protein